MSDHLGDRLDGWKAIADFMARDERTVQRWAKTRALPVHHLPGGKGASVFAFRGELEHWLAAAPSLVAVPPTAGVSLDAVPATDEAPAANPPVLDVRDGRNTPSWRLTAGLSAVVLVIAIAGIAVRRPDVAVPESLTLVGNAIVAQAEGRVLWRYPLAIPEGVPPDSAWRVTPPLSIHPIDLNADGVPVVLALVSLRRPDDRFVRDDVLHLSLNGELLWRYTPETSFTFGERTFDGPWRIEGWIATNGPGGPFVWLNVIHEPWWPGFVVAIDPAGQATIRFVQPGHIYSLAQVTNEDGNYVVAAGINNEYASASLAILDEQGPPAMAPSADPRYVCQDCPQGQPVRYILLPRSELNPLFGKPYNRVYDMAVLGDRLEASVQEVSEPHLRAVYRLSNTLIPQTAGLSDAYWEAHRGLERQGRLDHPAEACPTRRDGIKVRIWEPERGWGEENVRVVGGQ